MAISPMLAEHNKAFAAEKKLDFQLLSDPGNQTGRKYGLVYSFSEDMKKIYQGFGIDLPKHNGDDSWTLPIPARFIVDQSGIIRYAEANPDHTDRPEAAHTIEALKSLQS